MFRIWCAEILIVTCIQGGFGQIQNSNNQFQGNSEMRYWDGSGNLQGQGRFGSSNGGIGFGRGFNGGFAGICNNERGRLSIMFVNGRAVSDRFGFPCDVLQQCDPYLKVKANGEVWKGQTHWSQPDPNFYETATFNIQKNTKIDIEMWDSDMGMGSYNDDLMTSWPNLSVDFLLRNAQLLGTNFGIGNQNGITFKAMWTPTLCDTGYNQNYPGSMIG